MRALMCLALSVFFTAPLVAKPRQADEKTAGFQQGRIVKKVSPAYPKKARKAGIEGTVDLHVVIAKNGSILSAEVISGDPLLADAALKAVRRWRYEPSYQDGEPVEIDTTISVLFSLNKNP